MIIKMTANNNEVTAIIEKYLLNFWVNIMELGELTTENSLNQYHTSKRIKNALNPNFTYVLTAEDKAIIIKTIRDSFFYINRKEEDISHIARSLEISFLDTMEDKWENGEAVYWFQHSEAVITQ